MVTNDIIGQIMLNKKLAPVNRTSGIYFLMDDSEVVYVGQSVDIESRVLIHVKEGRKRFQHYSFFECDIDDLNEMESYFIWYFQPRLNVFIHESNSRYCIMYTYLRVRGLDKRNYRKQIKALSNQKRFWTFEELDNEFNLNQKRA